MNSEEAGNDMNDFIDIDNVTLRNSMHENPLLYKGQIAPLFSHKEEMIPTGDSEDELLKFGPHSIF